MKYDVVIAGGGLAGLMSGIALAREGRSVAIISFGDSALHFSSGSLEMWNDAEGALNSVAANHPYAIVGTQHLDRYSRITKDIFASAGEQLKGEYGCNHLRISPVGVLKPAWLTFDDYFVFDPKMSDGGRVVVVGIDGYLDFYPDFIADGLRRKGVECDVASVNLPELERLRESATEMRSVGISRLLKGDAVERLAHQMAPLVQGAQMVIMPAVFGLGDVDGRQRIERVVGCPVRVAPTASISVAGVRAQKKLVEEFRGLGGTYILGDKVVSCRIEDGRVVGVRSHNHGDVEFVAKDFILATGSFFSRGLVATPEEIYEPTFGAAVVCAEKREAWCAERILEAQPFQRYGVRVDGNLRVEIDGSVVENLYAVGSIVAGADAVKEGCGAGVVVATALMAAEQILGKELDVKEMN